MSDQKQSLADDTLDGVVGSGSPLPCPFCCGTDIKVSWVSEVYGAWHVYCDNMECMAEGPLGDNRGDAIARWNKRFTITANVARVDGGAAARLRDDDTSVQPAPHWADAKRPPSASGQPRLAQEEP